MSCSGNASSGTRIGSGVLNDRARTDRVKEKMAWIKAVAWLNGNSDCRHCRYGQLQEHKFVCALLQINTLKKSCCSEFHPGPTLIYQEEVRA